MKRCSTIAFLLCLVAFIACTIYDYRQLPEKVASHFNREGLADGWMSAFSFTWTTTALGLGIPTFILVVVYSIRFLPAELLNAPKAHYWRDPKNYKKACEVLFVYSLWFSCAFLIWKIFLSRLLVEANQLTPPRLDNEKVLSLTILLLSFTTVWTIALLLRFLKTDKR